MLQAQPLRTKGFTLKEASSCQEPLLGESGQEKNKVYRYEKFLYSSGDTIPNSEKLGMVSPAGTVRSGFKAFALTSVKSSFQGAPGIGEKTS